LFGTLAFDGKDEKEVRDLVMKGGYKPPKKLRADVENLLIGMLDIRVDDRYSIADLRHHKAFEFCRNQFASRLDRTLNQSYFGSGPQKK